MIEVRADRRCCGRCYWGRWSCDVHIFTILEFFRYFAGAFTRRDLCGYTYFIILRNQVRAHIIHIHVFTLSISSRLHTSFQRPKGISRSTLNCELIWFDRTQHFSVFCCIAVAAAATAAADVAAAAAFCFFFRVWIVKTRRRLYYRNGTQRTVSRTGGTTRKWEAIVWVCIVRACLWTVSTFKRFSFSKQTKSRRYRVYRSRCFVSLCVRAFDTQVFSLDVYYRREKKKFAGYSRHLNSPRQTESVRVCPNLCATPSTHTK